jgi:acyl dehydratase
MLVSEQFFEDYAVGFSRQSTGRTITDADIVIHAGQTGDFFPHHMDEEWCATQEFGHRIAHGTLIFSIGIGLTATTINPRAMSFGYDRLRFIKPVFIGDTIYTIRTNLEKRPRYKEMGLIRASYEVFKGEGELVLYCEHLQTVRYRDAAAFADQVEKQPA